MNRTGVRDRMLDIVIYAFLLLMVMVCLIPFVNVVSKSLSANWAIVSGRVGLWPVDITLSNIRYVMTNERFLNSFQISVIVTLIGTVGAIFFTAFTAYPLSKKQLPGVKTVLVLYVFTMLFSGGLIPTYLLIKQLGLLNHLAVLILPGLLNVFNMLLIKNYYESLPESLEESARMDGASNLTVILKIIIPLSAPVFATISLFYAVGFWAEWFNAMIYISKPELKPLQLYLRDVVLEGTADPLSTVDRLDLADSSPDGIRNATIIISTLPILCVYPFLQKYFIRGILIGSVKG